MTLSFEELCKNTKNEPVWVHFGGGNLFRCMHAAFMQDLIDQNIENHGIILAETWDDYLIRDIYNKYHNECKVVVLSADGSYKMNDIKSITEAYYVNPTDNGVANGIEGYNQMVKIFENPSLQMVTFAVTEKGYSVKDVCESPETSNCMVEILTSLLLKRFNANACEIALVSTDNFSHNGDKLKASVIKVANAWLESGLVDSEFVEYLNNTQKVSFPYSMIDRITPQPSEEISKIMKDEGYQNYEIVKTPKFTVSAPFVNTEETWYLVVEDDFPNGRPKLESAGVIFTSRDKVDEVERMKVCTCLNPLHTALAVTGCLLGYDAIYKEVQDADLLALIKKIGYLEGLPVVIDPEIISPKQFIDEVIEQRLPNPFIPDTPQRIATDTSQKIPIRFGVTIDLYYQNLNLNIGDLEAIPFVLAAWLRYLMGIDDDGNKFNRSPDPLFSELDEYFKDLSLGDDISKFEKIKELLSREDLFGVNLIKVGLDKKVFAMFIEMTRKPGAVRSLLAEIAI